MSRARRSASRSPGWRRPRRRWSRQPNATGSLAARRPPSAPAGEDRLASEEPRRQPDAGHADGAHDDRGDEVLAGTEQVAAQGLDHDDADDGQDDHAADLLSHPGIVDPTADDDPGHARDEPDGRAEQEDGGQP